MTPETAEVVYHGIRLSTLAVFLSIAVHPICKLLGGGFSQPKAPKVVNYYGICPKCREEESPEEEED